MLIASQNNSSSPIQVQFLNVLSLFCVFFIICGAVETDFTVVVKAGGKECFFQAVEQGITLEVEYQVVQGGDLDINFIMLSPSGKMIISEMKRSDSLHKHRTEERGDYRICLDNGFSRFSNKLVFFEIITDQPGPTEKFNFEYEDEAAELLDMKVEDLKIGFDRVKTHLDRSIQYQNVLKIFEARDRGIQERNFDRVNTFSGIQLFVMLSVGLVQVLMIRQFFVDKHGRLNKGLKAGT